MNKALSFSACLLASLLLSGCASDEEPFSAQTTTTTTTTTTTGTAPVAAISSPVNGATIGGAAETFTVSATDAEDGTITGADTPVVGDNISWSSDVQGAFGSASSSITVDTSGWTPGTHIITVTVTDADGNIATDTVTVTVPGVVPVNTPPSATISAPVNGATLGGAAETFTVSATDAEDGTITGPNAPVAGDNISWSSDVEGAFGNSSSFTVDTSAWTPGPHVITVTVTDSAGSTATDTINITIPVIGTPPTATITAPANGATLGGAAETFTVTANDAEDGAITGTDTPVAGDSISWESDVQGIFGNAASLPPVDTTTWTPGAHVITVTVTDSDGNTATDSINVNVVIGNAPTAAITAPTNGDTVFGTVNFTATANDTEDGAIATGIVWSSDVEGTFANDTLTPSPDTSLWTPGAHVITLSVTDSDGNTVTDTINITVDATPTATITAPLNGASISVLVLSTTFTVDAQDNEDGVITGPDAPVVGDNITWDSDQLVPGSGFGNSNSVSVNTSTWTLGTHVITVTVTDSVGNTVTDSISITITP